MAKHLFELKEQHALLENDEAITNQFPGLSSRFETAIDCYSRLLAERGMRDLGQVRQPQERVVQLRNLVRKAELAGEVVVVKILTRYQEFGEHQTLQLFADHGAPVVDVIDGGTLRADDGTELGFVITKYLPLVPMTDLCGANEVPAIRTQIELMTRLAEKLHTGITNDGARSCVDRFDEQLRDSVVRLKQVIEIDSGELLGSLDRISSKTNGATLLTGDFHGGNVLVPGGATFDQLNPDQLVFIDPQPPLVGLREADIGYMCGAYALRKKDANPEDMEANVDVACRVSNALDPNAVAFFAGIYGLGIATERFSSETFDKEHVSAWATAALALIERGNREK